MPDVPAPVASFLDVSGLSHDELTIVSDLVALLKHRGGRRITGLVALVHLAERFGRQELARAFATELTALCRALDAER
jgi:hypothetical protein